MKLKKRVNHIIKNFKKEDEQKVIAFSIMGAVGIISVLVLVVQNGKNGNSLLLNKSLKKIFKRDSKMEGIQGSLIEIEKKIKETKQALLDR